MSIQTLSQRFAKFSKTIIPKTVMMMLSVHVVVLHFSELVVERYLTLICFGNFFKNFLDKNVQLSHAFGSVSDPSFWTFQF